MKIFFLKKITNTDWYDFVNNILKRKHDWEHLSGIIQNDWKANYWGLKSAEHIQKVFI